MEKDSINPFYRAFSEKNYVDRINSPSRSDIYFNKFHRPLIEGARKATGIVKVLDLACGHGHEMDFMAMDPSVQLYGLDVSIETLTSSTRKRLGGAHLVAGDTEHSPVADNSMDVGIAVNAVVYKPDHMLRTLFSALKPGARCSVNFRVFTNKFNTQFYDYYLERNCKLTDQVIQVGGETFVLKVLDYRNCSEAVYRNLDRQVYFQSTEDIERLAKAVGFEIDRHQYFHFASPVNPDNEVDVYWFRKPWVPPDYPKTEASDATSPVSEWIPRMYPADH